MALDDELVMEEIFKTLAKEMPNSPDKEVIAEANKRFIKHKESRGEAF